MRESVDEYKIKLKEDGASDAEIKSETERKKDTVLDKKPHFAHAVQQISQGEEDRSCLVKRQIDISISAALVFTTSCFQRAVHLDIQHKVNSSLLVQSVTVCV